MKLTDSHTTLEVTDEPDHVFGRDRSEGSFESEILFESGFRPLAIRGLRCQVDGVPAGSAILGSPIGDRGAHERSCILLADRCLVLVGNRLVALSVPSLDLLWQTEGDPSSCFALLATADPDRFVVHGEVAISCFGMDGCRRWQFSGRDIFTGPFSIDGSSITAEDFDGEVYSIDLESGSGRSVASGDRGGRR